MVITALVAVVKALRAQSAGSRVPTSEEPDHPSTRFIPRGMAASAEEKRALFAGTAARVYGIEHLLPA